MLSLFFGEMVKCIEYLVWQSFRSISVDQQIASIKKFFFLNEVTIQMLPHLKCIELVSVRSSHLPFTMHQVGFCAFMSPLYQHKRANRADLLKRDFVIHDFTIKRSCLTEFLFGFSVFPYSSFPYISPPHLLPDSSHGAGWTNFHFAPNSAYHTIFYWVLHNEIRTTSIPTGPLVQGYDSRLGCERSRVQIPDGPV